MEIVFRLRVFLPGWVEASFSEECGTFVVRLCCGFFVDELIDFFIFR